MHKTRNPSLETLQMVGGIVLGMGYVYTPCYNWLIVLSAYPFNHIIIATFSNIRLSNKPYFQRLFYSAISIGSQAYYHI